MLFDEYDSTYSFARVPRFVELLGVNNALQRHDFAENSAHPHFDSALSLPLVAIRATHPQIDLADHHGPAGRPVQPALQEFGFGESIEHQPPRSVEDPCN